MDIDAIFNITPKYCPQCGQLLHIAWDHYSLKDWRAAEPHTCKNCGFHFQYADYPIIEAAAKQARHET